jgi:hypothetical protein
MITHNANIKLFLRSNPFYQFKPYLRLQKIKPLKPRKIRRPKTTIRISRNLPVSSKPVLLKTKYHKSSSRTGVSCLPNSLIKPYQKSLSSSLTQCKISSKKSNCTNNHCTPSPKSNPKNNSSSKSLSSI